MWKNDTESHGEHNGVGVKGSLFGLSCDNENARVVILPVPWEVTVSYHTGTVAGPSSILEASSQVDLYMREIPNAWEIGVHLLPIDNELVNLNDKLRALTSKHIGWLEQGKTTSISSELKVIPKAVNDVCESLNIYVKSLTKNLLSQKKIVGVLGGDHSTPLGLIRAIDERIEQFGILQIDAHADLREAYQGYKYSHASIMHNALKCSNLSKIVQIGVRDLCEQEAQVISNAGGRVVTYFDDEIHEAMYHGKHWAALCEKMIEQLPAVVYVSFDIDGLDPKYCPNTGTPVPGGLSFQQASFLIKSVVKSGRKIIGFDLCEVAPGNDDWDANVGARVLHQLCSWSAVSQSDVSF